MHVPKRKKIREHLQKQAAKLRQYSQAVNTSGRAHVNERSTLGALTEDAFVSRKLKSSVDEEKSSRIL